MKRFIIATALALASVSAHAAFVDYDTNTWRNDAPYSWTSSWWKNFNWWSEGRRDDTGRHCYIFCKQRDDNRDIPSPANSSTCFYLASQ